MHDFSPKLFAKQSFSQMKSYLRILNGDFKIDFDLTVREKVNCWGGLLESLLNIEPTHVPLSQVRLSLINRLISPLQE